jgi:hypothetical protein
MVEERISTSVTSELALTSNPNGNRKTKAGKLASEDNKYPPSDGVSKG